MRGKNAGQQGYALVLVVFMLAVLVITLATVTPNILVNGRRVKEEEMIWRGKQYVRGIRLFVRYYQMHGGQVKFPTSMDDLTKNKVGIRFMRQAYKDPVNTVDGSWRFIYVGPNGQLIGSLKQRPLGGNQSATGGFGSLFGNSGQPSQSQGSSFGGSSFGNSSFGNSSSNSSSFGNSSSNGSSFGNSSFGSSSFGNSSVNNGASATQVTSTSTQPSAPLIDNNTDPMSTPQAIATADVNMEIVGGNIIGVGSKVNQKSIIWYDKAKNYRQFEFIWDPSKEPVSGGSNAGVVGIPGQVPINGVNTISSAPNGIPSNGQQPGGSGNGTPGTGTNGSPQSPP